MNLTSLLSLCRLKVPNASSTVISDANATILLNNGALEIARKTKCLPAYDTFNAVKDKLEYDLTTQIPDYLCPLDDGYAYFYDGSEYTELDIVTISYMNDNFQNWLTDDSGDPERIIIMGDMFFTHPPSAKNVTDGFMFFYAKKPVAMDDTHPYPFGGATEIPRLTPYDTVILDYYEMSAYEILDINDPNSPRRSRAQQKYITTLTIMKAELDKDINQILLKGKKTRLRASTHYGESPF